MNGRTSTLTDTCSQFQQAFAPFLNVPVRITYLNDDFTMIFDTIIHRAFERNGIVTVVHENGVLRLEGEDFKVEGLEAKDCLFARHPSWNVMIIRWSDIPKEFRPYSKSISEMIEEGA